MSFLIPAGAALLGGVLSGKAKSSQSNKQNQYETDLARKQLEEKQRYAHEMDQRKMDSIDFLKAVAKGKGYDIPDAAFAAIGQRGAYTGLAPNYLIPDAPKQGFGNVLLGALGSAASTYGDLAGKAALQRGADGYLGGGAGTPVWDGGSGGDEMSLVDYYKSLLPEASDEIKVVQGGK